MGVPASVVTPAPSQVVPVAPPLVPVAARTRRRAWVIGGPAALGDREGAVSALQAAFREGRPWLALGLHLQRAFESLRDYPPFIELMKPKG